MIVYSPEGMPVAYRRARNIVLRNGAALIARLLRGRPQHSGCEPGAGGICERGCLR